MGGGPPTVGTLDFPWIFVAAIFGSIFSLESRNEFASWRLALSSQVSHRQWYHGRRAYRAWGDRHQWRMHLDIECSRLHAWSRVVEDDFGQSSIQAGPSVSCVPHFKACAAWKSAATRTWGSTGTGVGHLHARQFACCLAFCQGKQCWGCWVLIDWDCDIDRG